MKEKSRKFGQWRVTICEYHIRIVGDWLSNYGIIYSHYVERFKRDSHHQIIGMDNSEGLTKQVLAYIHNYVRREL